MSTRSEEEIAFMDSNILIIDFLSKNYDLFIKKASQIWTSANLCLTKEITFFTQESKAFSTDGIVLYATVSHKHKASTVPAFLRLLCILGELSQDS